jgi:hypothetical protein
VVNRVSSSYSELCFATEHHRRSIDSSIRRRSITLSDAFDIESLFVHFHFTDGITVGIVVIAHLRARILAIFDGGARAFSFHRNLLSLSLS